MNLAYSNKNRSIRRRTSLHVEFVAPLIIFNALLWLRVLYLLVH